MEEVNELKEVLDKIEGKLIASGKMYTALNFAIWGGVMLLYYLLAEVVGYGPLFTAIYWITGFSVAMYATFRVWKRIELLCESHGHGKEEKGVNGLLIGLSWGIGAVIGWFIIPALNLGGSSEVSLAVGFLSFITISVFGMWLIFYIAGANEKEMIPAFVLPALGIPVIIQYRMEYATIWAGFLVGFAFMVTVIWCLYSAFRAIEG